MTLETAAGIKARKVWCTALICGMSILRSGLIASPSAAAGLKIDGYREAKWGMTPLQVKKVLGLGAVKEQVGHEGTWQSSDYVRFKLGGPLLLECWFYEGKLFRVRYPFLHANDKFEAVSKILEGKYGPPGIAGYSNDGECVRERYNSSFINCIAWIDGPSRVTLWGSTTGVSRGYARNADYENSEIRKRAEAAESEAEKKQIERSKEKRVEQLRDQL